MSRTYANHELSRWIGRVNAAVSFGTKDLEWVVNYIRNQKEHHKKGATVERLEKITHDEDDES